MKANSQKISEETLASMGVALLATEPQINDVEDKTYHKWDGLLYEYAGLGSLWYVIWMYWKKHSLG